MQLFNVFALYYFYNGKQEFASCVGIELRNPHFLLFVKLLEGLIQKFFFLLFWVSNTKTFLEKLRGSLMSVDFCFWSLFPLLAALCSDWVMETFFDFNSLA